MKNLCRNCNLAEWDGPKPAGRIEGWAVGDCGWVKQASRELFDALDAFIASRDLPPSIRITAIPSDILPDSGEGCKRWEAKP